MYTSDPVRDRLLRGALSCLREYGYAETTARDIAATSGCNLRSIGYHFGSTKALLLEAISVNFRHWLEPLIALATDQRRTPAERLDLGMQRFAEALPENAPMLHAWLEAIVIARNDPELGATLAQNQAEFRRALAETLGAGGVPKAGERAAAIISVCDGLIIRFLLHEEAARPEQVTAAAAAAFALL
jgi:AcrR family transcriptional regulator